MTALELNDTTIPTYDAPSDNALIPVFEPQTNITGKTTLSKLRDMFALMLKTAQISLEETPIGTESSADVKIERNGNNVDLAFSLSIPISDLPQKVTAAQDAQESAETAQQNAEQAQTAAESALERAQNAQTSAETAQQNAESCIEKVPHFGEVSAAVHFLQDGEDARVEVEESGEDSAKNFEFSFFIPEHSGNQKLLFGFEIVDGALILNYADSAPDLELNENGELIFNY